MSFLEPEPAWCKGAYRHWPAAFGVRVGHKETDDMVEPEFSANISENRRGLVHFPIFRAVFATTAVIFFSMPAADAPMDILEAARKGKFMIFGAHMIIYSKDVAADRRFFRDTLGFPSVDAGQGWLVFALPPAELAVHPAEEDDGHEIYFMCDDLQTEISALEAKGIREFALIDHSGEDSSEIGRLTRLESAHR